MRAFVRAMILGLSLALATSASAAVEVSGRHVFVIHGGVDSIWGSYLFMVANPGPAEDTLSMRLMLPEETQDWGAQDGLTEADLGLGESGGVALKKAFPPGDNLLAVGFKVPAQLSRGVLTFKAPKDIGKIVVMARKGTMGLEGEGFVFQSDVPFSDATYDTLSRGPVAEGETLKVTISGVPEGRTRLWVAGIATFVVLALLAALMALKTRPRPSVVEGI